MLDSKSGKMRIGNEAAHSPGVPNLLLEKGPVVFRRTHQSNAGLFEPTLNAAHRFSGSERPLVQSHIGGDANVRIHHGPAKVHRIRVAKNTVPPDTRLFVVRGKAVFGIEKKIGVRKNHP